MSKSKITVAGAAAVWDYIFPVERLPNLGDIVSITRDCGQPIPGGCAPSIAVGIAKLSGFAPALLYPVGSEFSGSGLKDTWTASGVDCSRLTYVPDIRSGCSWMFMQPDGSTMCFSYMGAANEATPTDFGDLGEWVVIAPVLNKFTMSILQSAHAQNKKVILTGICSSDMIPFIASAAAIIINAHEAKILASHKGFGTVGEMASELGNTILYVTNGKKGSTVYEGNQVTPIPLIPEDVVQDFTGAGDAYTSGVVSGLIRGLSPVDAAYIGSTNSSFVVEQYGGQTNLPSLDILRKRLAVHVPELARKF